VEIELRQVTPDDPIAIRLLEAARSEVGARKADGGASSRKPAVEAMLADRDVLVAFAGNEPVGLGALLELRPGIAEIRRMYVKPVHRGSGVGRRLLEDLERRARAYGYETVRLDTHDRLTEANSLYRSTGYREIDDYNGNPRANRWYEKLLA
jgi:GNAT superfamily N-acetyltransferase